jgi:NitT/TauT family transport system substrate-binding protein
MMDLVSDLTRCLRRPARAIATFLVLGLAVFSHIQGAHAETARVVLQYGISYLPLSVMQAEGLWERRARELGLDLRVEWQNLGNGGALNDAILTGSADLAAGGLRPC